MKKILLSKKIIMLLCTVCVVSFFTSGCANTVSNAAAGSTKENTSKVESVKELYEKGKKEGKVVVYSTSDRVNDAKKSFEKKYPGIKIEVSKLKSDEMINKVISEQDARDYNADVIVTKEVSGSVQTEMIDKGRYIKFLPADIAAHVVEPYKTKSPGYVSYLEFRTIFYNTDDFKSAPVNNWWDLTTQEWKGKVYCVDPLNDPAYMDLFTTIVNNSNDMATAYKEKFGKNIVLNGTENAGYEFIKQLYKNGTVFLKGSDDVLNAISKSGKKAIGVAVSGDMSKVEEKGWHVNPIYNIKPKTSVPDGGYLYLAKNAPHSNAAKLFMRWMMGGADGKSDGINAFKAAGSWVPRNDVKNSNSINYGQLRLWNYDGEKLYKTSSKVRDFCIKQK